MNELVCSLRDVRGLLELGESPDHEVIGVLLDEIPLRAPDMSGPELHALNEEVGRLISLMSDKQADIVDQLSDIHQGRSGIDGYNHLKALHKAQRLSKRV